ncbi:uncharacterized protein BT62DRAFT_923601 [Guyanagaster necrorhizus]|uniref:Uncharacterized protein n=1 Tax=Guyanagaster necrorhizus TaxID=856835 RepID=A0A9P8AMR0_9AGAR|nr:uncharacterized protein BT62DRAFT_923601 [Guyanagaster necrorhizus MCA 3950]KAG7441019.1 hypothetical protein BT62DRAFT_923601 [Guyanagaster necrorhizus MCA 3950]
MLPINWFWKLGAFIWMHAFVYFLSCIQLSIVLHAHCFTPLLSLHLIYTLQEILMVRLYSETPRSRYQSFNQWNTDRPVTPEKIRLETAKYTNVALPHFDKVFALIKKGLQCDQPTGGEPISNKHEDYMRQHYISVLRNKIIIPPLDPKDIPKGERLGLKKYFIDHFPNIYLGADPNSFDIGTAEEAMAKAEKALGESRSLPDVNMAPVIMLVATIYHELAHALGSYLHPNDWTHRTPEDTMNYGRYHILNKGGEVGFVVEASLLGGLLRPGFNASADSEEALQFTNIAWLTLKRASDHGTTNTIRNSTGYVLEYGTGPLTSLVEGQGFFNPNPFNDKGEIGESEATDGVLRIVDMTVVDMQETPPDLSERGEDVEKNTCQDALKSLHPVRRL